MVTFSPLLDLLADIPDPRRAEGKLYKLPHVVLLQMAWPLGGCKTLAGMSGDGHEGG